MKFLTVVLFLIINSFCYGNMASPIYNGTRTSIAFSSNDIDILNERIDIRINKDFSIAEYTVEYNISSNIDGNQIPLLFWAIDYESNFQVTVDNEPVSILQLPEAVRNNDSIKYSFAFDQNIENTLINFDESTSTFAETRDLKYFEADIKKGIHKIVVTYRALATEDHWDWVSKYSFSYSLSPAKYWKSFGKLSVNIIKDGAPVTILIKTGTTGKIITENVSSFSFDSLPGEYIKVSFKPMINSTAKVLIAINPFGLMMAFGLILIMLHLSILKRYRKSNPSKKFNYWVAIGSFLVPFLSFVAYMFFFSMIDRIIGPHASGRHGYIFMIFLLYPIVMPAYLLIFWLIDKLLKRRLSKSNNR